MITDQVLTLPGTVPSLRQALKLLPAICPQGTFLSSMSRDGFALFYYDTWASHVDVAESLGKSSYLVGLVASIDS